MERTAIVCMHGFMGSPAQFDRLTALLEGDGLTCRCLTLPGHDAPLAAFVRSDARAWQAGVSEQLDALRGAYDRLVLVGHSMGGLLAIRAAADDPTGIAAVIAVALPLRLKLTRAGLVTRLGTLSAPRDGESAETAAARKLCGVYGITAFNSIRLLPNTVGLWRLMRRARLDLPRLTVPLTVIFAGRDDLVSERSLKTLSACLPGATVVQEAQAGHFLYPEASQRRLAGLIREAAGCAGTYR